MAYSSVNNKDIKTQIKEDGMKYSNKKVQYYIYINLWKYSSP